MTPTHPPNNENNEYVLAIDIGGTKIAAGLVNRHGSVVQKQVLATRPDLGAPAILQSVIEAGKALQEKASRFELCVVAIGIGSAGQVNADLGAITYASANLPGWSGLHLSEEVRRGLGLETFVDNDVNALALGEHHYGAGQGFEEVLYLAVGTGIGGAVVRQGEIWRGSTWSAGEICHLVIDINGTRRCSCGATGHLEAYTSGPAMVQRYRELSNRRDQLDLQKVAELARYGDGHAQHAIAEGATILGTALGGVLNVLDPEMVVIGGGVPEIGDLWWRHLEDALRANPMPGPARVHLRRAELGVDAVLSGAAWLAFDRMHQT